MVRTRNYAYVPCHTLPVGDKEGFGKDKKLCIRSLPHPACGGTRKGLVRTRVDVSWIPLTVGEKKELKSIKLTAKL